MNAENSNKIWQILAKKWQNILSITLIVCFFASILTITQPLKYKSSMNLLVIQGNTECLDYYSTSKSTQYLSDILTQVIYSSSFFNNVMDSGFRINDNFSQNERKRKKQWEKTIITKVTRDTGIITIDAYSTKRDQAEQIVQAISYVLKTKHSLYHGKGSNVKVKVIDQPITSNWPVKPNILANLAIALVAGLIIGAWFSYLFPETNIKLNLIPNKFKRKKAFNHKPQEPKEKVMDIFSEDKKEIAEIQY